MHTHKHIQKNTCRSAITHTCTCTHAHTHTHTHTQNICMLHDCVPLYEWCKQACKSHTHTHTRLLLFVWPGGWESSTWLPWWHLSHPCKWLETAAVVGLSTPVQPSDLSSVYLKPTVAQWPQCRWTETAGATGLSTPVQTSDLCIWNTQVAQWSHCRWTETAGAMGLSTPVQTSDQCIWNTQVVQWSHCRWTETAGATGLSTPVQTSDLSSVYLKHTGSTVTTLQVNWDCNSSMAHVSNWIFLHIWADWFWHQLRHQVTGVTRKRYLSFCTVQVAGGYS